MNASLTAQLVDDLHRGAGADAVGSGSHHRGHVSSGADSSRSFYSRAIADNATHKSNVIGWGAPAEPAGGSLDELSATQQRKLAGQDFFFDGEQAGFDDHFQQRPARVNDFGNAPDIQHH